MPGDVWAVYVACADHDEARRIGRTLVEEKLVACVNLRPHEAIYRWNNRIETAQEYGLLAKTTSARWPDIQARIKALHSYDTPCVVAWELAAGNPDYLRWVADSVSDD